MKIGIEKIDLITNENIDLSLWDQRNTLKPPPYKGAFKAILNGLNIGDPRIDSLPISKLCSHGQEANIEQDPDPHWVDWELINLGQKLWCENLGRYNFGLTGSLLTGFSIARFAEILYVNGYAQSGHTAFTRYSQTSFYILDWLMYPLNNPNGRARKAIYTVRAMHAFARKRATEKKIFDPEKGEGIALSQYDMAEVLMAFSAAAISLMENELGLKDKFNEREQEAMIHVWRLIGYHLGIMDEYNICTNLKKNREYFNDWMLWTPQRLVTSRECTHELQRTAIEGFGCYTGFGEEIWVGVIHKGCKIRNWDLKYLRVRDPLPGISLMIDSSMKTLANDSINYYVGFFFTTQRECYLKYPSFMQKLQKVLKVISKFNDIVVWRIIGLYSYFTIKFPVVASQAKIAAYLLFAFFAFKKLRLHLKI